MCEIRAKNCNDTIKFDQDFRILAEKNCIKCQFALERKENIVISLYKVQNFLCSSSNALEMEIIVVISIGY